MRIILLLDDKRISAWQNEIVKRVQTSGHEIVLLVMRAATENHTFQSRKILYRLFRWIDRSLFRSVPDAFERVDITITGEVPILHVAPIRKGLRNAFPDEALQAFRNLAPDVIIRFGFGIVSGNILKIAKHGVWSLHHGDTDYFRGGPPGFWEWFNKVPFTGVTLQRLSEELDGGEVIEKMSLPTDFTSVIRNQNKIFWAGTDCMLTALSKHDRPGAPEDRENRLSFYSERLYRDPRSGQALTALSKLLLRALQRNVASFFWKEQWIILCAPTTGNAHPAMSLRRYRKIVPPRDRSWADPFVVSVEGKHFVFIEEFIHKTRKGHISCIVLDANGGIQTGPTPVLSLSSHLSYPFIFQHEGNYYMVPESADAGSVDLYRCIEFPLKWKYERTLMSGIEAYDTTLHFRDGLWWMFQARRSGLGGSVNNALHVYYAHDLASSWKPHPRNPVVVHARSARPAGRIFLDGKDWYRPSQQCAPRYGYAININRIKKLTTTEYEEETASQILPNWVDGLLSTHTLNFTPEISIVDGQIRRSRL